jgi:hypothetical protein
MAQFVITVRGEAGPTVRAALDEVDVTVGDNVTVLRADLADQAALHGLLHQLRDFGIGIIEVRREDEREWTDR